MDNINWRFANKFGSYWIKIKFYKNLPARIAGKCLRNVRFCEATKEAKLNPIILDRESISCDGALYAFGWEPKVGRDLLGKCNSRRGNSLAKLKSVFSRMPRFKKPFGHIGLNTEGAPEVMISYMPPAGIMRLLKIYNDRKGKSLEVSLQTMVPICGGVAVRSYLKNELSLSLGCDDSRRYAGIGRESMAVGIPKRLFGIFLDEE